MGNQQAQQHTAERRPRFGAVRRHGGMTVVALAVGFALSGCGAGSEESASAAPVVVEFKAGDSAEITLPPYLLVGSETPSTVTLTLNSIRYERSTNTEGNVYAILDMGAKNTGTNPANLRGLTAITWEGADGLVDSHASVFCAAGVDELEYDLKPGQRTTGCKMVDVPDAPGTLTLDGVDKDLTIALDPASAERSPRPTTTAGPTVEPTAAPAPKVKTVDSTPGCVTRLEYDDAAPGMPRERIESVFGAEPVDVSGGVATYQSCDIQHAAFLTYGKTGGLLVSKRWTGAS